MKNLFSIFFSASFVLGGVTAVAQQYTIIEDLTSKLTNADFKADAPLSGIEKLCTYDYDMPDAGAGAGETSKFGLQPITGWTANFPSDNIKVMNTKDDPARTDGANSKAAGIFSYDDDTTEDANKVGLGGTYYAPYTSTERPGPGLGIVAVWGAEATYSQDITLPAGAYMVIATLQNTSGTGSITNKFGFKVSDTEYYTSKHTSYAVSEGWVKDTVTFLLEKETSGKLTIGYATGSIGSADAPHLFYDEVKIYSIEKTPLIQEQINALKAELLTLIEDAEFNKVDTKDAYSVYNDANASLEAVQAAYDKLKADIEKAQTDLSAFFITNPHFTLDTPLPEDNGICTYDYDMVDPKGANERQVDYYGMQPVEGWVATSEKENARASGVFKVGSNSFLGGKGYYAPTSLSDGSTEGNVLGFVDVWLAQSQYTQAVTIPAGNYTLEISYYNAGGTGAVEKNLMGFIAEDGTEYLGKNLSFETGKWIKEKIKFTLEEETTGQFSMGYKAVNAGSGSMPHLFIEGIALAYAGDLDLDPSLFALQAAAASGRKTLNDNRFFTELEGQLEAAVSAGEELVESKSDNAEANTAAANAINELMPAVKANIKAYEELDVFYNETLQAALEKYASIEQIDGPLNELNDELMDVVADYTYSTDQINETIASLDVIIKDGVKAAWDAAVESGEPLDEPLDITVLFDQMAYTYSTTAQSNTNVPDKEWVYGSASNFKTQYGTAEVWNQSPFEVSRTLKDMPAGTYTITTKAFYRTADNAANIANYVPSAPASAFVFAGYATTGLTNVAEIASSEAVDGWAEVDGVYVPNSQQNGYNIFNDETYTEKLQKSVSTVLGETGDLKFGVKASQLEGNSWVLWYSFSIAYNAPDAAILSGELEGCIAEAETLKDETTMNDWGAAQAADAIEAAKDAVGKDIATVTAALSALNAAMDAMKANAEALVTVENACVEMNEAAENAESMTAEAAAAFAAASAKYEEASDYTTEQLVALTEELSQTAAIIKVPSHAGASDAAPVDMTATITNPSFEAEDGLYGWTYYKGADTQAADNSNATYTVENADGAKVFNTWNGSTPEGGFYVSQVIRALPAGTYKLTVLVASDQGNSISVGAEGSVEGVFYDNVAAMANAKEIGEDLSCIFKLAEGEDLTIKVSSQSWFKADNFRLEYYGTESTQEPTIVGVSDIETAESREVIGIYNAAGVKVNAPSKGINIIRYNDNTTKTVIIR